ncbi:hypothetical protein GDO81_009245 [Engystomops pustulosus]|uniref:Uncharacterized protein n=1 Tax=Engystomops pustulosus TaxID=76066 RepID=A0AAV7BQL1_ENGPU|nr:hypothetical protein GDO81_009245 [Engystomops pustulosus]
MASYFDEHNCEPTVPEEQYRQNALLELARSLLSGMDIDIGGLDVTGWDHRLPPPAAKKVVENLPKVTVTAKQAGKELDVEATLQVASHTKCRTVGP